MKGNNSSPMPIPRSSKISKRNKKSKLRTPENDGPLHPLEKLKIVNPYGIVKLLAHTQELESIARQVVNILPTHMIPYCRIANIRGSVLVLQADSPTWATRLRYHGPEILKHLQNHGWPALTTTKIMVAPAHSELAPSRRAVMSNATIIFLREFAQTCSDPEICAAWERLARTRTSSTEYVSTS